MAFYRCELCEKEAAAVGARSPRDPSRTPPRGWRYITVSFEEKNAVGERRYLLCTRHVRAYRRHLAAFFGEGAEEFQAARKRGKRG